MPTYCSWRQDPGARMTRHILSLLVQNDYIHFPPFCLVGRILLKIYRESVNIAFLMAGTALVPLALVNVVRLFNFVSNLLLNVNHQPNSLQEEGGLYLTAWPISGRSTKYEALFTQSY